MKRKTFLFGLCLSLLTLTVAAQGREVLLEKSFPNKRTVNIKTISGDCLFKRGTTDSITVLVVAELSPAGAVETVFSEEGTALTLQERWVRDHSSGNILWTITLPEGATVNASSLSGDITGEDLKGEFKGKTASGDILLNRCNGSFSLRSASGDLTLQNVQGSLSLNTASGDISLNKTKGETRASLASGDLSAEDAQGSLHFSLASGDGDVDVTVTGPSSFRTASGDMKVSLNKSPSADLSVASASGDASLNFKGNPMNGIFEMTARKREGRIAAPFSFEKQETFTEWGEEYEKKSVRRGGSSVKISLSTATGRVEILER